ncbi:MAG: alpha/beta hydrolase, partial [Gammaproteobacteria bacterium]|nr:alpha/beta hydrolase [Gammaproteobacteria bacterium]
PILVLSGTADPVHGELKNLDRLFKRYAAAGLNVSRKLYVDGRHEMFNDINRVEVLDDLVEWLDGASLNRA